MPLTLNTVPGMGDNKWTLWAKILTRANIVFNGNPANRLEIGDTVNTIKKKFLRTLLGL